MLVGGLLTLGLATLMHDEISLISTVVFAGIALGSAVAGLGSPTPAAGRARVAHPRVIRLGDLLSPVVVGGTLALLVAALIAVALTPRTAPTTGVTPATAVLMLAYTAAATVVLAVATRRALRAPRTATSPLELAWQDGFAARAAFDAWSVTALLAAGTLASALLPEPWLIGVALALALLPLLGTLLPPRQRFRTRLWDDREFEVTPEEIGVPEPGRTP